MSMIHSDLQLLWPLNNNTYTSEVIKPSNTQDKSAGCNVKFQSDIPSSLIFPPIHFDGTYSVDIHLENNVATDDTHFSFSGWFKSDGETAALFHYKTDDDTTALQELKLVLNSSNLEMTRQIIVSAVPVTEMLVTTGCLVTNNTWHYISFGIDYDNGKFKVQLDENTVMDIEDGHENDIDMVLPGTLRIGRTFDNTHLPLIGYATCVGFHTSENKPNPTDTAPLCMVSEPLQSCKFDIIALFFSKAGRFHCFHKIETALHKLLSILSIYLSSHYLSFRKISTTNDIKLYQIDTNKHTNISHNVQICRL